MSAVTGVELDAGDTAILEYHAAAHVDTERAVERFCADPGASSAGIDAALGWVQHRHGHLTLHAIGAAVTNPATSVERLRTWATAKSLPAACVRDALVNPALGPYVCELTLDDLAGRWVLANPAADPGFVSAHWTRSPRHALANPSLPAEIANTEAHEHVEAVSHPDISEAILRTALHAVRGARRAAAAANPRLDETDLRALEAREAEELLPNTALLTRTAARLAAIEWERDPLACAAVQLRTAARHPQVQEVLTALDPTVRGAAASLLDAGFEGTVAELLDIARTFR